MYLCGRGLRNNPVMFMFDVWFKPESINYWFCNCVLLGTLAYFSYYSLSKGVNTFCSQEVENLVEKTK